MDTGYEFKIKNSEEGMTVNFKSPLENGFMPVETAQEVSSSNFTTQD